MLLRRRWTCTVCEKTFSTKEAVEGHIVNQHQSEVDEDQDTDSDEGMESDAEDSDYKDEESDDSVARYLKNNLTKI